MSLLQGNPSRCIPSVLVLLHQKHLFFQIIFVHFVFSSSMKILPFLKSLKQGFSKKNFFSLRRFHFLPKFLKSEKPHPMGETRPWSRVGPGGLLGGPSPKKEPIWLPRAHSAAKYPNPANPPQCRKPAKGMGPVAW